MPSKRQPPEPTLQVILDEMRGHSVILEDMRSQNQATIEAVEAARVALEQRIERLDQGTRSRDALLELAVRELRVSVQQNTVDIRDLKAGVQGNTVDIRDLAVKVEALARLEERVTAGTPSRLIGH